MASTSHPNTQPTAVPGGSLCSGEVVSTKFLDLWNMVLGNSSTATIICSPSAQHSGVCTRTSYQIPGIPASCEEAQAKCDVTKLLPARLCFPH